MFIFNFCRNEEGWRLSILQSTYFIYGSYPFSLLLLLFAIDTNIFLELDLFGSFSLEASAYVKRDLILISSKVSIFVEEKLDCLWSAGCMSDAFLWCWSGRGFESSQE